MKFLGREENRPYQHLLFRSQIALDSQVLAGLYEFVPEISSGYAGGNFLYDSWNGAVFWICVENNIDNTGMFCYS